MPVVIPDAAVLSTREKLPSLADVNVQLITSLDQAMECKRWLSTKDRIAVDTESAGLNSRREPVRLVQLGDEMNGWVIPVEGVTYNEIPRPIAQRQGWGGLAVELLSAFDGDIDMHNATYDHSVIKFQLGVNIPRHRINDTRLMAHVLDSQGPLGLKPLAKKYVDPHADLGQELLDNAIGKRGGYTWATVPIGFTPYWFYAGLDTILTSRLRSQFLPRIQAEAPRSYALEMAVAWPCRDMEHRGTRLDQPYVNGFARELDANIQQLTDYCMTEFGVRAGSNDEVIAVLRRDGVNLVKKTASGAKFSLDKSVLVELDHPLAQAVLTRRQALKTLGYLTAYLGFADEDGLIHPSINTVGGMGKSPFEPGGSSGVRTGRMSMSEPNLQNVPTRTVEGAKVRASFIPREGHTWIKCDADQIESRILAHLSGDPRMQAAFRDTERDFFVNMASQLFHDPDFQKSDPRRQFVKNGVYAKIYSAGIPRFAETTHSTVEEAAAFMNAFDAMYPQVPAWISGVMRTVKQRYDMEGVPYARSPLTGRMHRVEPRKMYPIVNYIIQGMAGEVLKLKIVQADAAGLGEFMLFPVHDEIDFDVPNDILPDVMETLKNTMNDNELLDVPVTWSADVGPNWGACKG